MVSCNRVIEKDYFVIVRIAHYNDTYFYRGFYNETMRQRTIRSDTLTGWMVDDTIKINIYRVSQ